MDQQPYPGPPLLFHFRMVVLFLILWLTDLVTFTLTIEHTLSVGVGGMVLFASEVLLNVVRCAPKTNMIIVRHPTRQYHEYHFQVPPIYL